MKEYKIRKVKIKDGSVISGYEDEYIFKTIDEGNDYYEGYILNEWTKELGLVEVVFDIGANIGNHTVYFAKHTEARKIYSFEPFKMNFDRLVENVKSNKIAEKVITYNEAIGEKTGQIVLKSIDEKNLGSATFEYSDDAQGEIEIVSIDEFVKGNNIKKIDFVKIDTEGFEESVLKGMTDTLVRFTPTIWIEVNFESFENVNRLLMDNGYTLVSIKGSNLLYKNIARFPDVESIGMENVVEDMLTYYDKTNKYYNYYLTTKQWVDDKNKIIERRNEDINRTQRKLIEAQEELSDRQGQIIELATQNKNLEKVNQENSEKINSENIVKEELRKNYLKLNKRMADIEEEKEELLKKLENEKAFSSRMENNFASLTSIIKGKDDEIHFLKEQRNEHVRKLELKEAQNEIQHEKNIALDKTISVQDEAIKALKRENESVKIGNDDLKDKLKKNEEESKDLERKYLSLSATVEENEKSMAALKRELNEKEEALKVTRAGIETRNQKIKAAEKKVNEQIIKSKDLQKKFDEFNTLLYQSRKLNSAYERFPSIKFYNWARKLRKPVVETPKQAIVDKEPVIERQDNIKAKAEINKTEIKFNMLFSDFRSSNNVIDEKHFALREDCKSLDALKVACIMDEFTFSCFEPECNLFHLTPENWKEEIEGFRPDMLFIESAWQGNSGKWYGMIVKTKPEFCLLTEYCHEKNLPVIFWNKEDPVHNEGFMAAAGLCDFVFTTEVDCIAQYKRCLGHDRVYFLHFAAQPKLHNPVETFERKDMFCFAGAYYMNYPERTRVFNNIAHYAMRTKGIDIYDRNYDKPEADHHFPEYYKPFILGSLKAKEIDKAYKRYAYNINANSGTWTQTMFARRVFELMASNTVVVGNFSRGLRTLFGDTAITTDNVDEMAGCMERYCDSNVDMHRYRLKGHRKVSKEDLYEDRLDYIVQKVFDISLKTLAPRVTVVSRVANEEQLKKIKRMVDAQNYGHLTLCIEADFDYGENDESVLPKNISIEQYVSNNINDGFVAYFDANDCYGENYISDMMLMLRYGAYDAIGKSSYYNRQNGWIIESNPYHIVSSISVKRAVIKHDKARNIKFTSDSVIKDNEFYMISVHEFDYVESSSEMVEEASSSMKIGDYGMPYAKIEKKAEEIKAGAGESGYVINVSRFFKSGTYGGKVEIKKDNDRLSVVSTLDENKHTYIYSKDVIKIDESLADPMWLIFEGQTTMDVMLVIMCHDENMKRVGDIYASAGLSKKFEIPLETKYTKLAMRVKGSGSSIIGNVKMNKTEISLNKLFLSKSNVLVLTNIYPSYDDLYRNAFVHQRVKEYKRNGLNVNVMCFNNINKHGYREFEGIDVINGFKDELEAVLESGSIDTVCVHFLDRNMWEVLEKFKDRIRILVWCHGSEIQPWWRREFIYETKEELEEGKKASAIRVEFWKNVFSQINDLDIHFIFVSDYFKNVVFEDYNIDLPESKYSIIHNYINTSLFDYVPKSEESRKHVLSIRPFGTSIYANDLTVKCIKELSTREFFKELKFHIIGRGKLFNPLMNELKEYDNVIFENKFLRQYEIAELHKKNGIFMVPTRLDSQGVSRDEAMSSGLVPITNNVAAIPEFVDNTCGMLAPADDYVKMADDIERLYNDSELFKNMSEAAAERVRRQSSRAYTIDKEIYLINK